MHEGTRFELDDPVLAATLSAPGQSAAHFGVWQIRPSAPAAAPSADDVTVWRTHLPPDPARAEQDLRQSNQHHRALHQGLEQARHRVVSFAKTQSQTAPQSAEAVSFGLETPPDRPPLPPQEAELQRTLYALAAPRPPQTDAAGVSFALPEGPESEEASQEALQQVQALATTMTRTLSNYAWIETVIADTLIGRTAVRWTGDVQTIWHPQGSAWHAHIHTRSVQASLSWRATLLRKAVLIMQGAALISSAVATPGGPVMALPAIWKFIDQILDSE
jgi:hypothetical protein